ncbi:MAG TPA: hypothetical protein VF092_14255 [Longimicrobium sp.]
MDPYRWTGDAESVLAATPRALAAMRAALAIHRDARLKDAGLSREITDGFAEMVMNGEPAYRDTAALLGDGDAIASPDFAERLFDAMRWLIDASLHPLILDLLAQRRIARGKRPELERMRTMHFSYAVEELTVTAPALRALMEPPPWGWRLSDWRVAQVDPDGSGAGDPVDVLIWTLREKATLPISRAELLEILRAVLDITTGLAVARTIEESRHTPASS